MATAFDTAAADINTQRAAANAAIAAGGSAGAQAFAQGQQQIEAARTAALSQALSEAAQRGQGNIGGVLTGIVNRPYQQLGAGLASSAASHAADSAFMGARSNDYFNQLGAAVPMAQQGLEAKIAMAKAKAAAKNALSDSELRTRLLGAGELTRTQDLSDAGQAHHLYQTEINQAKTGIAGIDKQLQAWRQGKPGAGNVDNLQHMRNELELQLADARNKRAPYSQTLQNPGSIQEYARKAGVDSGEDPYRVAGLIQMPTGNAKQAIGRVRAVSDAARQIGIGTPRLQKITSNTEFSTITNAIQDDLKKGVPYATVAKNLALYKPGKLGRMKALALAMYQPAFGQG